MSLYLLMVSCGFFFFGGGGEPPPQILATLPTQKSKLNDKNIDTVEPIGYLPSKAVLNFYNLTANFCYQI